MNEIGIDISEQRPKDAKEYFRKLGVTYAVFVCSQAERDCPKLWPFAPNRLSWPVDDPAAVDGSEDEQLAAFRGARDALNEHIQDWLRKTAHTAAVH